MSRGYGLIEKRVFNTLYQIKSRVTVTMPNQLPTDLWAARVTDICAAMYNGDYTRSQHVSVTRAVKSLVKAGKVKTFQGLSPGGRGNRRYLWVEYTG